MEDGYYHGINKLKKPATKVMAPPGGATNLNIFAESEPETRQTVNTCQAARSRSTVFTGPAKHNPSRDEKTAVQSHGQASAAAAHPSTKVLSPPGGQTNISIFGGNAAESKPPAAEMKRQEKHHTPGPPNHSIFGGEADVIGQRARNRKPPGGESHNIFG